MTASTALPPKRKANQTSNERQNKRQKTRPLTTEDITAIVKAVVGALPEASRATTEEDDATATTGAEVDEEHATASDEVDKEQEPSGNEFSEFSMLAYCWRPPPLSWFSEMQFISMQKIV